MARESLLRDLTEVELDYMVAHILRCADVAREAAKRLSPDLFDDAAQLRQKLLYSIFQEFWARNGSLPDGDYMLVQVSKRSADSLVTDAFTLRPIYDLITKIYTWKDGALRPAEAIDLINHFIMYRTVGKRLTQAVSQRFLTDEQWAELTAARASLIPHEAQLVDPFKTPCVGNEPRRRTGITWLDAMMGGGFLLGEACGFLAPTGGGKTTIGHQITVEGAKHGNNVLFVTYEASCTGVYSGTFFAPVYACATRISRNVFVGIPAGGDYAKALSADQLERFEAARKLLQEHVKYADLSTGAGASGDCVAELEQLIQQCETGGMRADIVIVDWFWKMIERGYAALKLEYGKRLEPRQYAGGVLNDLKRLAQRRRCFLWINHQLAAAVAEANKSKLAVESAMEIKSFPQTLDMCFTLTKPNEGYATISAGKVRSNRMSTRVVKLEGEYSTFISADTFVRGKDGKYADSLDQGKVPGATSKAREAHGVFYADSR